MRDADTIDDQIITALAQDRRGFLWIGTQDGLIRYDGYRYRKFSHDANRENSLIANYVYSLYAALLMVAFGLALAPTASAF